MTYRVTLSDDNGNEGEVVVRSVEFLSSRKFYAKLTGVGPLSYPSWVTDDEYDDSTSFTSKGPSLFLEEGCPIRVKSVESTDEDLTHPSFDT